ncbi:MAG: hypothetical protein AVDCRST_MAG56-2614, partial [uncultured Cytophagales bacterium]
AFPLATAWIPPCPCHSHPHPHQIMFIKSWSSINPANPDPAPVCVSL